MTEPNPRVALIHGTLASIAPATAGMTAEFPSAEVWNILDDKLLPDADASGGLTARLVERMNRLIALATSDGAAAVLLACSMYGPVAQSTNAAIPVLSSDEAAFEAVLRGGFGRVLVLASVDASLTDAVARLTTFLSDAGSQTVVVGRMAEGALAATKVGDEAGLAAALVETARPLIASVDAILLAQYSLAPAATTLEQALKRPVISGPQAAALKLRAAISA
jgi:hypothetical protein